MQPGKARKGSRRSQVAGASKQVAAAAWAPQDVQPQHAEAEVLEGGEPTVASLNQVADLETILQERDACGVGVHHGLRPATPSSCRFCPVVIGWWFAVCLLQVGFIANLRAIKSHTIVEQVRTHVLMGGWAPGKCARPWQQQRLQRLLPLRCAPAGRSAQVKGSSKQSKCGLNRPGAPIDSCRSCGHPPDAAAAGAAMHSSCSNLQRPTIQQQQTQAACVGSQRTLITTGLGWRAVLASEPGPEWHSQQQGRLHCHDSH